MKTALVIGFGSIGSRHARLIAEVGLQLGVVTKNFKCEFPIFDSTADALTILHPDLVIVCNETVKHEETIVELAQLGFLGTVLVEKPMFHHRSNIRQLPFANLFVAYNLRFHPVLQALRLALVGETVIAVQMYAGQFLPNWRPDRDYRLCYSAKSEEGGGVLRDLSHELDMLLWLFGHVHNVAAIGGKLSNLDIQSDDTWAILMSMDRAPVVTVQLNYLDRVARREIIVNTDNHSFCADLVRGSLECDGVVDIFKYDRDYTYKAQLQAVIHCADTQLCDYNSGCAVLDLIDRIEDSAIMPTMAGT